MLQDLLRRNVDDVLAVTEQGARGHAFIFGGVLRMEPARAREILEPRLRGLGFSPFLSREGGHAWLQALPLGDTEAPARHGLTLTLFLLTVVSTLADSVKQRLMMPRTRRPRVLSGEDLAASLLRADWLYWPSLAFRRELLVSTPFRDGMPIIQDLALVIDVVCAGGQMLLEPTLCFQYRRHTASASSAKALDGSRFRGERDYFRQAGDQVAQLGWRRAERAARTHLTSRLHALTLVPQAITSKRPGALSTLLRHAFRPGTSPE